MSSTNRKSDIIKATLELASENGLGTVSMNQIADKVGISKPSLYNHFSSKDEIVSEMYSFLRNQAKQSLGNNGMDFDSLGDGRSLKKILTQMVESYKQLCTSPEMFMFYKIIMSQRSIDKSAAEIMVMETRAMIDATKKLFYALQVKNIANFYDADAAALSFAMAVHSIIDYECDLNQLDDGAKNTKGPEKNMMKNYIEEFSRIYAAKEACKNGKE